MDGKFDDVESNEKDENDDIGISTAGKRLDRYFAEDSLEKATSLALQKLENSSVFFEQNSSCSLPNFLPQGKPQAMVTINMATFHTEQTGSRFPSYASIPRFCSKFFDAFVFTEVELGATLGQGEFGVVSEVTAIHSIDDCPCQSCQASGGDKLRNLHNDNRKSNVAKIEGMKYVENNAMRSIHKERSAEARCVIVNGKESTVSVNTPSSQNPSQRNTTLYGGGKKSATPVIHQESGSGNTLRQHRRIKSDQFIPPGDSTLSTCSYLEDDMSEAFDDGEEEFLRGYMSTHCYRKGVPRYAVKRVRPDLKSKARLVAVMDLAAEGKRPTQKGFKVKAWDNPLLPMLSIYLVWLEF